MNRFTESYKTPCLYAQEWIITGNEKFRRLARGNEIGTISIAITVRVRLNYMPTWYHVTLFRLQSEKEGYTMIQMEKKPTH